MTGRITFRMVAALSAGLLLAAMFPAAQPPTAAAESPAVPTETVEENGTTYAAYRAALFDAEMPAVSCTALPTGATETVAGETAAVLHEGETAVFSVTVEQAGVYRLRLRYYLYDTKDKDGLLSLSVDGARPFDEAGRLSLNRIWIDDREGEAFARDAQDNDIRPTQKQRPQWAERWCQDTDGYYDEPYAVYFSAGSHTLEADAQLGDMALSRIVLENPAAPEPYAAVRAACARQGYTDAPRYAAYLQAEQPAARSSSMLYPLYDRSGPATQPSHYSRIRLNTIGGTNWSQNGAWIEWRFSVPESGLYTVTYRARQNVVEGLNSYRTMTIDGRLPYAEAERIAFAYDTGWQLVSQRIDGEDCRVYLEQGEHTLRLAVNVGPMAAVVRELEAEILQLNTLYRRIIMVTGVEPDVYRTYDMEKEMPDIDRCLEESAAALARLSTAVRQQVGDRGSQASIMDQVTAVLEKFRKNVDRIPEQISSLKDAVESLGTLLQTVRSQPLELDYIYIASQADMPTVKAGFWEKLRYDCQAFAASFFEDYSALSTDVQGEAVTVWVNTGRDQAQIIKKLMDDRFSVQYGTPVKLSLVNSSLINAILAGQGPDVALMVDQSTPVNLAMRGALRDLSDFNGFSAVLDRFTPSSYEAFRYQGGVYALPNTQEFDMLFYRTDILEEMGLSVPQTWEEFYHAVSILQKHNLTVGVPETDTANLGISSGIGTFNRFLLQNGGAYYNAAQTQTLFDTKTAYQAFTRWTELYTEYGLDREFNFYNRFRSGEMPLGIQSFSAYNMLAQAAPEIRGLWSFTSVPGTRRADGTVDRAESSTVTGCIMLKNAKNPAAAWRLMEWWSREDTQADYGNELEATMGSAARYAAANVEAFAQLNWTNAEQAVLAEQRDSVVGIPEIPGSYFISRCLTNAFRNVVSSGESPVRSLNQYNKDINAEIARKRTEFGLD